MNSRHLNNRLIIVGNRWATCWRTKKKQLKSCGKNFEKLSIFLFHKEKNFHSKFPTKIYGWKFSLKKKSNFTLSMVYILVLLLSWQKKKIITVWFNELNNDFNVENWQNQFAIDAQFQWIHMWPEVFLVLCCFHRAINSYSWRYRHRNKVIY